ncbi:MAG: hypothetical protein KAR51_02285 [Candidatus Aenigmarchaeota archaeon]|nr:hypothetical protein [Candidatus Aenigmarchaeota archaeon]
MVEDLSLYRERMLNNGAKMIAFSGKPDLYMDKDYNTLMSENCCAMGMQTRHSCDCNGNK